MKYGWLNDLIATGADRLVRADSGFGTAVSIIRSPKIPRTAGRTHHDGPQVYRSDSLLSAGILLELAATRGSY